MKKDHISHALAQIDFHRAQAAKWAQYVALHNELYGEPAKSSQIQEATEPQRISGSKTGTILETRELARLILDDAHGYVQGNDLIAKLAEMGVEVGGANPASTLSARLSGDPEIESRRGHGYRLKRHTESEEAAGSSSGDEPAASLLIPDSADEGGPGGGT